MTHRSAIDARRAAAGRHSLKGNPPSLLRSLGLPTKAAEAEEFFASPDWISLRYRVLKRAKGCCECCGRGKTQGAVLQVDHIKPRSKFPALALSISNLQCLCQDCNLGKSNTDQTDWRTRMNPQPARETQV